MTRLRYIKFVLTLLVCSLLVVAVGCEDPYAKEKARDRVGGWQWLDEGMSRYRDPHVKVMCWVTTSGTTSYSLFCIPEQNIAPREPDATH